MKWKPIHCSNGKHYDNNSINVYQCKGLGGKPIIPCALQFSIVFDKDNMEHQNLVFDQLSKSRTDDNNIELRCKSARSFKRKICVLDEYKDQIQEIETRNKVIEDRYNHLVSELTKLGCDPHQLDDCQPTYEEIPDHMYQTNILVEPGYIDISCHDGTPFYQSLLRAGLLNKLYPEWVKKSISNQ